jgi:hypothetical protein
MKKVLAALGILISLTVSGTAMATPVTTWVDNVANQNTFNNGNPDYSFIYNITGSGNALNVLANPGNTFHPGIDLIGSADLLLNFSYAGATNKTANIVLDINSQSLTNFTIQDKDINLNAGGVAQLNADGTLRLDIHRTLGTFTLTDSILTASGTDYTPVNPDPTQSAPVPEPGTVILLGAGFFALAVYSKRRKQQ